MNLAGEGDSADYIVTGHWSEQGSSEAAPYVHVNVAASSKPTTTAYPSRESTGSSIQRAYVHYTPNETIHGVEFHDVPDVGSVPLVADMSSTFCPSRWTFALWADLRRCAEKHRAVRLVVMIIIRRDLLAAGRSPADGEDLPLRRTGGQRFHAQHAQHLGLVSGRADLPVAEALGGLSPWPSAIAPRPSCFTPIDGSGGFYRNPIDPAVRSRMNVPFTLHDSALDAVFLQESEAAGLLALKGHKALGGMRASLYNAVPLEAVEALTHSCATSPAGTADCRRQIRTFRQDAGTMYLDFFTLPGHPNHERPQDIAERGARSHRQHRPADPAADLRARQLGTRSGPVKGEGLSAIDYYRPEREAHVLRMVVDRNDGPLSDTEMVRLFREIMSSCLAQEDPLKIGFLGPEGTFSEQAVRKHFGHAAYGCRWAASKKCSRKSLPGTPISAWCRWRIPGRA
jgi:phosphoserine aminotransferase